MESTGNYWQTLFSALQSNGFEVILVDGRQTKSLRKKTDVQDARAIYQMHSLGLLSGCFLPEELTQQIRVYHRHRSKLVVESSGLSNRIQQSLRLMNIRLDNVLSDVMGKSGKAMIRAILGGERAPKELSKLADSRVKKSPQEIEDSLVAHWKDEQLYILQDCFSAYESLEKRIEETDNRIKEILEGHCQYEIPESKKLTKKRVKKNQHNIGLEKLSYQYYGVDLFSIPSVSHGLVLTLISELGNGYEKFSTSKEFTSYLRLAPNNRISGGKKISGKVPRGKNPLAIAFRNAANTVGQQKSGPLARFFKRKAYQKGRRAAITATARKMATIVWNMLSKKEAYLPMSNEVYEGKIKKRAILNMQGKMKRMGIDISELKVA
jgi:transposase